MARDFIAEFPIPGHILPAKVREFLSPIGLTASERVEVSCREDSPLGTPTAEHAFMSMAVVPEATQDTLFELKDIIGQVVSFSVPVLDEKGASADFNPNLSGHDYIVASWGSGSSYTFNLAEKVWMALGLTPRCLGGQEQRLAYDDLSLPIFGVAEGDVSAQFYWNSSRDIHWWMLNEHLRNYLWMRGSVGVRTFFYQGPLEDCAEIRALMDGKSHICIDEPTDWFRVDIREHQNGLLLQVWAAVVALSCERCEEATADGLDWPGVDGAVTAQQTNAMIHGPTVYLDDQFLERYEQNAHFDALPFNYYGDWQCNPSYKGQWSFTDCRRVGRNTIEVPLRELYKAKPDKEILHAHAFAITPEAAKALGSQEEHIASKTARLLEQLLFLGDNLTQLGRNAGIDKAPEEWVGLDRGKLEYSGWGAYGQLGRLAQVAPLKMTQQAFLARCKSLHEIWQRIPDGPVRKILIFAGVPQKDAKDLRSLKLLQALLNIVQRIDTEQEPAEMIVSSAVPEGWNASNLDMAALFINNDLRIADAHEAVDLSMAALERMGFEVASLNVGYGKALDFVFDGVIRTFEILNQALGRILAR